MSSKLEKEFLCLLHSVSGAKCSDRRYDRTCEMKTPNKFTSATCPHRVEALVITEEEDGDPTASDVQNDQPNEVDSSAKSEIEYPF